MILKQIDSVLDVLEKYKSHPKIVALISDINTYYRPLVERNSLPRDYVVVWDASIIARLSAMTPTGTVRNFDEPIAWIPKPLGAAVPRILFGQLRIASSFQGSKTVNQTEIVGFPADKIVGRPLEVVAGMMRPAENKEVDVDAIPVQIFFHEKSNSWVAANNRGYAVHCLAGCLPLRLIPRLPEQLELNRLKEVENEGDAKRFTYETKPPKRLKNRPHSLPSEQIPITAGPNSWDVTQIAEVPS
jgi:hypothetical protein